MLSKCDNEPEKDEEREKERRMIYNIIKTKELFTTVDFACSMRSISLGMPQTALPSIQ